MTRPRAFILCLLLAAPAHAQPPADPFAAASQAIADAKAAHDAKAAEAGQLRLANDVLAARAADAEARAERYRKQIAAMQGPMAVGFNASEITEYSSAAAFTNVLWTFTGGADLSGWGKPGKPWESQPGLTLTPDGYPLADAESFGYAFAYPDGLYQFSMEGSGDVAFAGKGRNVAGTFQRDAAGVLTGSVQFTQTSDGTLRVRVRNIDPANPPRNMRLTPPGCDPAKVLTPWYAAKVKRILSPNGGTVRFMLWGRTNGSPHVAWAGRKRPTEFTFTGPRGAPYEVMAAAANELGADAWVCVPHAADDEYPRELARLFKARLDPAAVLWWEYSNEAGWNGGGGFAQGRWLQAKARDNPALTLPADPDIYGRTAQQTGLEAARVARLGAPEWADRPGQFRPLMNAQAGSARFARVALEYLVSVGIDPAATFYALTPAHYVGIAEAVDQPGLTMDALFAGMFADVDATGWLETHAALAERFGLKLVHYEAGQHLNGLTPGRGHLNTQLKIAAQQDPRMGDVYRRMVGHSRAKGARLMVHFTDIEKPGKFGFWGLWDDVNSPDGPRPTVMTEAAKNL